MIISLHLLSLFFIVLLTNLKTLELTPYKIDRFHFSVSFTQIQPNFFQQIPSLANLIIDFSSTINRILLESLFCLTSLERLEIISKACRIDKDEFARLFGPDLLIIENLVNLRVVKLPRLEFLNFYEIQKKIPSVRFIWFTDEDSYEGDFSSNNVFEGYGRAEFSNGNRYEVII